MSRIAVRLLAATAAMITATVAVQTPAFAINEVEQCLVYFTSCQTDNVPAHSTQHWVKWTVGRADICVGDTSWRLVDANSGATVASGTVSKGTKSGTVYGLYGSAYHVTVFNSCTGSRGVVQNYT